MSDFFQMMPMSMRIGQGDTAVLKCLPPKASPRPTVTWLKNGEPVNPMDSKRVHITDTGMGHVAITVSIIFETL
jgi:Immunoglobulin I-set domain